MNPLKTMYWVASIWNILLLDLPPLAITFYLQKIDIFPCPHYFPLTLVQNTLEAITLKREYQETADLQYEISEMWWAVVWPGQSPHISGIPWGQRRLDSKPFEGRSPLAGHPSGPPKRQPGILGLQCLTEFGRAVVLLRLLLFCPICCPTNNPFMRIYRFQNGNK